MAASMPRGLAAELCGAAMVCLSAAPVCAGSTTPRPVIREMLTFLEAHRKK